MGEYRRLHDPSCNASKIRICGCRFRLSSRRCWRRCRTSIFCLAMKLRRPPLLRPRAGRPRMSRRLSARCKFVLPLEITVILAGIRCLQRACSSNIALPQHIACLFMHLLWHGMPCMGTERLMNQFTQAVMMWRADIAAAKGGQQAANGGHHAGGRPHYCSSGRQGRPEQHMRFLSLHRATARWTGCAGRLFRRFGQRLGAQNSCLFMQPFFGLADAEIAQLCAGGVLSRHYSAQGEAGGHQWCRGCFCRRLPVAAGGGQGHCRMLSRRQLCCAHSDPAPGVHFPAGPSRLETKRMRCCRTGCMCVLCATVRAERVRKLSQSSVLDGPLVLLSIWPKVV